MTLQQSANITIGNPNQASALVCFINGVTQPAAKYFGMSIQNMDIAASLLYMFRMPTGRNANFENYLSSPLPGLLLRLQPAVGLKRGAAGTSAVTPICFTTTNENK